MVSLIRLPYRVRILASISRLRRRARSFSDVEDTCFHGQRLGDAIAGEEKARSDHCGDEGPRIAASTKPAMAVAKPRIWCR